jgi:hypothetical protein
MLKVAVGHSIDPDSTEAIAEVLTVCQSELGDVLPQAGILFCSFDFDHESILAAVANVYPELDLIGCTSDGELSSQLGFQQDSMTLILFSADDIEFRIAVARNISQDPMAIARHAAAESLANMETPAKLCIALPESLTTDAVLLLEGLADALGAIPIVGGAAADHTEAQQTKQFYKTEVLSDALPLLLMGGNLACSTGVAGGWQPIGKRSQITKVEQNVVYEIDHQPALKFYQYYLDDLKVDAAYPLAFYPPGEEQFFLRGHLNHDLDVGSITFSGGLPEGAEIQITDANLDDVIQGAQTAMEMALANYPGAEPAAALFFSCAWRRWIMGTRSPEEYQTAIKAMGKGIPACGFYTFGEIAPLQGKNHPFFHNTTFVSLLIGN